MNRSFFSRLAGSSSDDFDYAETTVEASTPGRPREQYAHHTSPHEDEDSGGELAVDVYQTPDSIVIKAFIAGVQPNTVDVSLTREMVTITGKREDEREVEEENYFRRELYWGSFSRAILLPEEVDVDMAEATEKHGILIIRLPKINKKKEMRLKIRTR